MMRKRLVWAVMAMLLLLLAMTSVPGTRFSSTVDAQTELDRAREDVRLATEQLESFLAELEAAQRTGDELAGEYWQVESGLAKLDLEVAASEQAQVALAGQRDDLQAEVRIIAVDQYVSRTEEFGLGDYASEADRAAAETLARLVVGADTDAIGQLAVVDAEYTQARDELERQRGDQRVALLEVQATQASLFEELDRLAALRLDLDRELQALEEALASLERAEAERQAAAAEQARIAEERRRAAAAAAAAAAQARAVPTPAPVPTPQPTMEPTPVPEPTVPNPQPSEPFPTPTAPEGATSAPNPQLPDPTPVPEPTVPNPQPSEPFPTPTAPEGATSAPNPQLPDPTPEPEPTVPNPQLPDPTPEPEPTVPNPQPSGPVSSGGIVCPLAGPFTHTDDFSAPRAVGGIHRANDLISAQGTPVLAAASGTVEHRNSSVGGLSAHLKGDNGDYYFYTHLSAYENVGAGRVAAGTVIGYVGMTGNAPIPHLHFEIHTGGYGNYANPYGPVRNACF